MKMRTDRSSILPPRSSRSRRDRSRGGWSGIIEALERRSLLATLVGQVFSDVNGNGLRDVAEPGQANATVQLDTFDAATGATTLVATQTTGADGVYQFTGLAPGLYKVSENNAGGNTFQTYPTVEHQAQSYLADITSANQTLGGTLAAPLAAPADNWLASLSAGDYTFYVGGDFMFQFGSGGIAPSRVAMSGTMTVHVDSPTNTSAQGDGQTLTTATTEVTQLSLQGVLQTTQHDQGYQGLISMSLTPSTTSTGAITQRRDSAALADSSLGINATITLPPGFGASTVQTQVPIDFLAREIGRFPAFGSSYARQGTEPPIPLVDASGAAQGKLFFASLNPTPGVDFAAFQAGTIQGTAFEDLNHTGVYAPGDPLLANQPITLQNLGLETTTEGDSGSGSSSGQGGPPPGVGEGTAAPVTVMTDASGHYIFNNLGPGNYTIGQRVALPWTQTLPAAPVTTVSISPLTSGASITQDFGSYFTPGQLDIGEAPAPYPTATHVIVQNFHLGQNEDTDGPPGVTGATASDTNGLNDEDGVVFNTPLIAGQTATVTVTATLGGQTGYLDGWVDFNGNGNWTPADQIFTSQLLHEGANTLTFPVPASAASGGPVYARFRLSSTGGLTPSGSASDGEVEDYKVNVYQPSALGTINGQTFVDTNGDNLHAANEPGQNGWTVQLVDLATGHVVATQITASQDLNHDGQIDPSLETGLYQFNQVVPGQYELIETPPSGSGTWTQSYPASGEGPVTYRFTVSPGQTLGMTPQVTASVGPNWIANLPAGTDSSAMFGQFTILTGGSSGGSGGSGGIATGGPQIIRISVTGSTTMQRGAAIGGVASETVTSLVLQGIAVSESETDGSTQVLGPVTITLWSQFQSGGTLTQGSGSGSSPATASLTYYFQIDATSLGLGVLTNTRPIVLKGDVTQLPFVGTSLRRQGGSPVPLRDALGGEPARLQSVVLDPAFGLDLGNYQPGSISGNIYVDQNGNGSFNTGEPGLAGATVTIQQAATEGGAGDVGSEEGSGGGGSGNGGGGSGSGGGGGGSGNGEGGGETAPLTLITTTDASGNWSVNDLPPGTYTITVVPPSSYRKDTGAQSQTATVVSGGAVSGQQLGFVPNTAPVAAPGSYNVAEDQTLTVPSPGVLAGATDANQDPLTAKLVSPTSHGTVTLNPDGSFAYSPAANYFGTDQFTYVANDGTADSAPATVTINVSPVIDPPVFAPIGDQTVQAGMPLTVPVSAAEPNPAPPPLPIVYSLGAGAPRGASIDPTTGVFRWTPSLLQGPATYIVTVVATEDGAGGLTSSESFSITVASTIPHDPTSLYVASLYQNVLGRQPEPAGLALFTTDLRQGASNYSVAARILASPEHLGIEVDGLYQSLLGRQEAASERNAWVNSLMNGLTYDQAYQLFLASPEYQALHASDTNFIDSLYQNVLGRAEATAERDAWLQSLQSGVTRAQVAQRFVTSTEAYTRTIENLYRQDLGRPSDATGLHGWVTALETGALTSEQVEAGFLGSTEYYDLAIEQIINNS